MNDYTERPQSPSPASQISARFPAFSARLRDILLVTHAVPVEKAVSLLPPGFVPDVLPSENGESVAFVQCLYSRMENVRVGTRTDSGNASDRGLTTLRVTLRLLIRREGKPGAFLLKQFLSDSTPSLPLRLAIPAIESARISAYVAGSPLLPMCDSCDVQVVTPKLRLRLLAKQDVNAAASSFAQYKGFDDFLTARADLYSLWRGSRVGVTTQTVLDSPAPYASLALSEARLPLYTDWFGLEESAPLPPASVLWRAGESVRFDAPRLFRVGG